MKCVCLNVHYNNDYLNEVDLLKSPQITKKGGEEKNGILLKCPINGEVHKCTLKQDLT